MRSGIEQCRLGMRSLSIKIFFFLKNQYLNYKAKIFNLFFGKNHIHPFNSLFSHKAFSLAEVLITLGVIGVVAAMTIPTLIKDYQKTQIISKLKKAYTVLIQATTLSKADNGDFDSWDWGDNSDPNSIKASFDKYWAPYLKVVKYCSSYTDCNYKYNHWHRLDNSSSVTIVDLSYSTTVVLEDGTVLEVYYNGSTGEKYIYVDIDGGNGPAMHSKDVFMFEIDSSKGIVPYCYTYGKTTIDSNCSSSGQGQCCVTKIIKWDNWQIADDYPW